MCYITFWHFRIFLLICLHEPNDVKNLETNPNSDEVL